MCASGVANERPQRAREYSVCPPSRLIVAADVPKTFEFRFFGGDIPIAHAIILAKLWCASIGCVDEISWTATSSAAPDQDAVLLLGIPMRRRVAIDSGDAVSAGRAAVRGTGLAGPELPCRRADRGEVRHAERVFPLWPNAPTHLSRSRRSDPGSGRSTDGDVRNLRQTRGVAQGRMVARQVCGL